MFPHIVRRAMSTAQLSVLKEYSACDVSDALLKLKVPGSGFLGDLITFSSKSTPIIAPASTVLFTRKSATPTEGGNISSGKHYVDLTVADTIVVMAQPPGQSNAILGGIMALRMQKCGAMAVIVDGRVRDMAEIRKLDLIVLAKGKSTVGAGAESVAHSIQVPIVVNGNTVNPGDIIFADDEGAVSIPKERLDEVIKLLPGLVAADDKVKEAVADGMTVKEAFATFR